MLASVVYASARPEIRLRALKVGLGLLRGSQHNRRNVVQQCRFERILISDMPRELLYGLTSLDAGNPWSDGASRRRDPRPRLRRRRLA